MLYYSMCSTFSYQQHINRVLTVWILVNDIWYLTIKLKTEHRSILFVIVSVFLHDLCGDYSFLSLSCLKIDFDRNNNYRLWNIYILEAILQVQIFKFIMNLNNKLSIDLKPYLQSTSKSVHETKSKQNNLFLYFLSNIYDNGKI